MKTVFLNKAPIRASDRSMLQFRLANLDAAAKAKGSTINAWEKEREIHAGKEHFELGCWLWYYSNRVGSGPVTDRIDCARRIFLAGLDRVGYEFFTAFDFGERQFDAIFEMGDSDEVLEGLREHIPFDKTGRIKAVFEKLNWPLIGEAKNSLAQMGFGF